MPKRTAQENEVYYAERAAVRERLRGYLIRSRVQQLVVAKGIGVSPAAISRFLDVTDVTIGADRLLKRITKHLDSLGVPKSDVSLEVHKGNLLPAIKIISRMKNLEACTIVQFLFLISLGAPGLPAVPNISLHVPEQYREADILGLLKFIALVQPLQCRIEDLLRYIDAFRDLKQI